MSASDFALFATALVGRHEANLMDYGPEEQAKRVLAALERFHSFAGIRPAAPGHMIDLAGFGEAPVHFESDEKRYLLVTEVGTALGMPVWESCEWARKQHQWDIEEQRRQDEERGDGRLGWECLDDYCDLGLWCATTKPPRPGTGKVRHTDYGEWLVSHDRLLLFIADSPWSKEFMANTKDLFAMGAKKFLGGLNVPAVRIEGDGTVSAASADDLFHTDLSEEEARRKARRGPNIPLDGRE